MKEKDKAMARDISKTDISNMHDREFKATIIRMFTGLQKRREDISETVTTDIKELTRNQSEMSTA